MRKHILAGLGGMAEGAMIPFVPTWVVAFCGGLLLAACIAAYAKELRIVGAGVFRSREARMQKFLRRLHREDEEKRMRRIAEATVMHYVEDPQQRGRIAEKIRERWEKEDRAARRSDDERSNGDNRR